MGPGRRGLRSVSTAEVARLQRSDSAHTGGLYNSAGATRVSVGIRLRLPSFQLPPAPLDNYAVRGDLAISTWTHHSDTPPLEALCPFNSVESEHPEPAARQRH